MHFATLAAALALAAATGTLWMQGEKKRFAYPWPASQEEAMAR